MIAHERRGDKRYALHYPILLRVEEKDSGREEKHLAEILDAGVGGMRLQLTHQQALRRGREVTIFCEPARKRRADENWTVFELRCRVVWENPENLEVGLNYIN